MRTGPRTGQMRIDIVEAVRSQLTGSGGLPSPAACCFQRGRARCSVLPRTPSTSWISTFRCSQGSSTSTVNPSRSSSTWRSRYSTSTVPSRSLRDRTCSPSANSGQSSTMMDSASKVAHSSARWSTMSVTVCNDDGTSEEDICQQVGSPGESLTGINPTRLLDTRGSGGRVGRVRRRGCRWLVLRVCLMVRWVRC